LVRAPAAEGLPDLVATLEQLSSWRAGDPYLLDIIADRRLGPAAEWGLRRFQNVTWVDDLDSWAATAMTGQSGVSQNEPAELGELTVLLTPADEPLSLEEGFVGQDFAIRANWTPAGLSGQSLIRWIVLRSGTTPASYERAVLWVKGPSPPEGVEEVGQIGGESIR
jgi:hypothetical protein